MATIKLEGRRGGEEAGRNAILLGIMESQPAGPILEGGRRGGGGKKSRPPTLDTCQDTSSHSGLHAAAAAAEIRF